MRIAIVAPLFAPITPVGSHGNLALIIDLAQGLAGRGHHVTVHAAEGSCVPGVEVVPVPVEPRMAETFVVPGRAGAAAAHSAVARSRAVRRAFERAFADVAARRPDAVSQHAFDVEAVELGEGCPVVHTLHMPPIVPDVVDACRAARRPIAAVSMAGQQAWEAATHRCVGLLRNGVPDFLDGAATFPSPNRVRPAAIIAGRISPEKGSAAAIRLAQAAGLEPCVLGAVSDEAYFEAEVAPLLDGRRPVPVPRAVLARLMAGAAVTLMPICWDEPFGLVAAEAQMSGCPVVAYRRGALPEIVTDGVGGYLVEPGDEPGFLAAIGRTDRLDRAAIRRHALARFGVERTLTAYERELERVAAAG